jgi:hypothetical protein
LGIINASREIKEMHEYGIGSKIRERRGRDDFTMCCTAAVVVWCCSSAQDDRDGAVAKIISATNHVLHVHERRGSKGSIWCHPVVHEDVKRG